MILLLAAWGVRNYRLFGQVVLLTTNLGPHNAYDFGIDKDAAFSAMREQGLNEAEINREFLRAERLIARQNPGMVLRLWLRRISNLLSPRPAWEVKGILWAHTLKAGPVARMYRLSYAQYCVVYVLTAVGLCILALRRQRLGGLWLLLLFFIIIHAAVSRGDIRLAAPIYPIFTLIAAAGLHAIRRRLLAPDLARAR
jgi:hypothetical protein